MRSIFAACLFAGVAIAQPPPQGPPPLECGTHGDIEIICGTHSPEDLELTPDGKYLIVAQFVNGRGGTGAGLALFDLAKKTFSPLTIQAEPKKDWGDPACSGPVNDKLIPHGISLAKNIKGATRLYVVNHGGRQSIEMYELKKAGGSWDLAWHGCVPAEKEYNDLAITSDGGFIATHPTALAPANGRGNLFSGEPSGFVVRWTPGKPEEELPGTRQGYPNGVLASPDGRYMYFNAWTAKEVHKYDLKAGKDVGVVKLDFMPDNLTWTSKGQMLAAGVKGARGDCPTGSGTPCIQGFGIAELNPAIWDAKTVFDSQGKGNLIPGVSVALQVGNSIFIGSFQGDRIVEIGWKQ
ncbi:MAG TPA: SMP-30/gluconolactonase/LRE family protein [Bryobacteraceae bacterium]|nr:SMP-30/gluconolactonase/LRE family protein [Bryobacteraceae bacterium]